MATADHPHSSQSPQSQEISPDVLAGPTVSSQQTQPAHPPQLSVPSPLHSVDTASASDPPQDNLQPPRQQRQSETDPSSPGSPNSSSSDVHGETGQVPSPPEKPTGPPATPSATMSSIATPSLGTVEKEKDAESSLATTTLSIPFRKHTRRKDDRSTSEGKYAPSSTGQPSASSVTSVKGPPTKKSKTSLFTKISHIFSSCVSPSHRTHVVDVDEGPSHAKHQKDQEKALSRDADVTKEASSSREPSSSSTVITAPPPLRVVPPSDSSEQDIVVPPTPTKQLLPLSETDGLTSGAVQPPGSTGEEGKTEHHHSGSESGDESDASYSDDDMLMAGEDEEERLIRQGGAGIPIGPDGVPKPLLPPIEPRYAGRKCLVLDLDETLVHSSLKPVPSPDFIVPVEIEHNWHNFYVLKRPGVDNFLKKMGEIYEVVVFTASLSKYADPVLDRLDPTQSVAHRLFRESCYNHRGNYVKDLSQLGRPIGSTIIIDNSPASYIFHPHNAVPVTSWFSDVHDTELGDMVPFLADLCHTPDVRGILNPGLPIKN